MATIDTGKVRTSVYLDPDILERLKHQAADEQRTVTAVLNRILAAGLGNATAGRKRKPAAAPAAATPQTEPPADDANGQ